MYSRLHVRKKRGKYVPNDFFSVFTVFKKTFLKKTFIQKLVNLGRLIHIKYLGTFFYSTCILNELCMFSVRAFNIYLRIHAYFTLDAILASTNGVNK